MRALAPTLALFALGLIACGDSGAPGKPTGPSSLAFSVAVQVQAAGHAGGGRLSPMAVTLNARNELGIGAPIVDGAARLLDSSGALLAEASIPSSPTGAATIGLAWPQESAGRTLELRIDIRDGTGAVRALEATLAL